MCKKFLFFQIWKIFANLVAAYTIYTFSELKFKLYADLISRIILELKKKKFAIDTHTYQLSSNIEWQKLL